MAEIKVPVKPVVPGQKYDKSRNVLGGHEAMVKVFPFVNFFMFLFGMFTVPVEVFLRRNFGQRWFTAVNFSAGLFVLGFIMLVEYAIGSFLNSYIFVTLHNWIYPSGQQITHYSEDITLEDTGMFYFLCAYVLLSSYHFFRMWWQSRTGKPVHSFDDGTSRLEKPAGYLMYILNILVVPFLWLYSLLLPKKERERKIKVPKLIEDRRAFTNTFVEPLFLFVLAYTSRGYINTIWLGTSAFALLVYANWKEMAKKNKSLDFRDAKVEAEMMRIAANGPPKEETWREKRDREKSEKEALALKKAAQPTKQVQWSHPDVATIIEEMNRERLSHIIPLITSLKGRGNIQ